MRTSGEIFKELRKDKGLTLYEAGYGYVEESAISKFENHDANISFKNFMGALDNLNLSLEEFQNLYNFYNQPESLLFRSKVQEVYISGDIKVLNSFKAKLEETISTSPSPLIRKHYALYKIIIEAAIFYLDDKSQVPKKDYDLLTKYLSETKKWYHFELFLFHACSYLFQDKQLLAFMDKVIMTLESGSLSQQNRKYVIASLLNIFSASIFRRDLDIAKQIFTKLNLLRFPEIDALEHLLFAYHTAHYYLVSSGEKKYLTEMEDVVHAFHTGNMPNLEKQLHSELEKIKLEMGL